MESVYQDEAQVSEVELTPQEQLRLQWQQQPGAIPLLRQKNVIDQNAELLPFAAVAGLRGWISPGMFALQGLVLIAVIAAGMNWLTTRHSGKLEEEITALQASSKIETKRQEEIISATQAEIRRISSSPNSTFKLHISATPLSREQALTALNNSLEESRSSEEQYKENMAARERNLRACHRTLARAQVTLPSGHIFFVLLLRAARFLQ